MQEIPLIGISIWTIAKVLVIFALVIYSIFAVVVVRQVQLMIETINVGIESALKTLAYAHLAFALIVLLVALIVL